MRIASVTMFICLIGLLSFQAYWISTVYSQNKADVESDIRGILNRANRNLLIKKLGSLSGVTVRIPHDTTATVIVDRTSPMLNIDRAGTVRFDESGITLVGVENDSLRRLLDTTKKVRGFTADDGSFEFSMSGSETQFVITDFQYMDSVVSDQLKILDLSKDYFFGLWDDDRSKFDFSNQSIKKTPLDSGSWFYVRSFDIGNSGGYKMYLNIPKKNVVRASLSGVGSIIIASVIMLVLLISAWYYIIQSLQRQYRLAQIKDDFIGNMTHELKTPVTASSLALEVMSNDQKVSGDSKLNKLLGVAKLEQNRILQIINSILDNTSAEEDISQNSEDVEIGEELDMIVESMRLKVQEKGGRISLKLPNEKAFLHVNRMHLQNAILNLIENAVKYTSDELDIQVELKTELSHVEISIADNGIGISSEDQKRVFDKFFRVHTGNVHDVKGYGLGLTYTKSVIEQFGGSIGLESKVGEGSTFFVKIPKSIL